MEICSFILLFGLSVFLFVRQCRLDSKAALKRECEADLHMLREFKEFYDKKGLDSTLYAKEIERLERGEEENGFDNLG